MNKINAFACLTLLSTQALAGSISIKSTGIDAIRISQDTSIAYINPTNAVESINTSCSKKDFYTLDTQGSNFNSIYSSLLAAGSAKKDVLLWISDTNGDCLNNQQHINVVEVIF